MLITVYSYGMPVYSLWQPGQKTLVQRIATIGAATEKVV